MIGMLLTKFILCLLAGLANAAMDTLRDHYHQSVFRFWDEAYFSPDSWKNKYTRPWYIPVELTDFWHLCKGILLIALIIGVALPSGYGWGWNALACRVVFGGGFVLGYNWLFIRK